MSAASETFAIFRAAILAIESPCLRVTEAARHLTLHYIHDGLIIGTEDVYAGPDYGLLVTDGSGKQTVESTGELLARIKADVAVWKANE